jgi:hypothetical protein
MSQSVKSVCTLVLIVASFIVIVVWTDSHPSSTTQIVGNSAILTAILSLAALLFLHFRRDLAHDYLLEKMNRYFNRDGFCFAFDTEVIDGVFYLQAFYQNQYQRPLIGRIAIRPAQGFFLTRAKIKAITFNILCEAAAYGVASVPIPVPYELQGKRQAFDVGAYVKYPKGKGRRLRFRDGIFLRTNTEFGSSFQTAVVVAGAMTGQIVLTRPAKATIQLPAQSAVHLPEGAVSSTKTLWKFGDRPIAQA